MDSTCEEKVAVALKYDPSQSDAPFVVAKGKCWVADVIIDEAKKAGVPVIRSPELVHDLYELDVLQEIPSDLYLAVAQILIFLTEL